MTTPDTPSHPPPQTPPPHTPAAARPAPQPPPQSPPNADAELESRVRVYRDTDDWWIGYYRGETHHYVCPLPTVVIRWSRQTEPPQHRRSALRSAARTAVRSALPAAWRAVRWAARRPPR